MYRGLSLTLSQGLIVATQKKNKARMTINKIEANKAGSPEV